MSKLSKSIATFSAICLALVLVWVFTASSEKLQGKRYIFIDGGAHIGETILHFEKSKLYSQYPWEMFSFEANPNLIAQIPKPHASLETPFQ